jgi:hypothetical protein
MNKNDWIVTWKYNGVEHQITGVPAAMIGLALFFVFCLGVVSLAFILIGFFV